MKTSPSQPNLDARQRLQAKRDLALTPAERIARFVALQAAATAVLQSSPGYQHFIRRNMHERRVQLQGSQYVPLSPARRAQLP